MRKILFISVFIAFASSANSQGYKVTLQTPNYSSGIAYLIYYYGNNKNIEDSAIVNNRGTAVFSKPQKLLPGIYAIVFPGKSKLLDFFVDKEQVISIKADTADLVNKSIISGKENPLFIQYQKFIYVKGRQLQKAHDAYIHSKTKQDSLQNERNYDALNKQLTQYRENIISQYPQSMLATLFKSMKEPVVPIARPKSRIDSVRNYEYYKKHYWDGISFSDDRIIRTPFFLPKVEKYFRDIVVPSPDSIIRDADYLLLLSRTSPEMYKFLLNWLTDEYIYPKYMGQDAVFVHLFERYHSKGVSNWLNEKQLTTISNRAYMLMANLIGEKAADLEMVDENGKPLNLYDVKSAYTIVCFWDPTCSHCKEEIPKLDSIYKLKWKQQGVKIYAVLTEDERPKWLQFIRDKHLGNWINVYQTDSIKKAEAASQRPGYRQLYDVTQTPILYLLDSEKRIIAKKLTWLQMDDVLQVKFKNQKG